MQILKEEFEQAKKRSAMNAYLQVIQAEAKLKEQRELFLTSLQAKLEAANPNPDSQPKSAEGYNLLRFVNASKLSIWSPFLNHTQYNVCCKVVVEKLRNSKDLSHTLNSMVAYGNITLADYSNRSVDGTANIFKKLPDEIIAVLKEIAGDSFQMPVKTGTMRGKYAGK